MPPTGSSGETLVGGYGRWVIDLERGWPTEGSTWSPCLSLAARMSGGAVIPRVSMAFLAALVLYDGGDVPDAYFERQRVLLVHAAQLVHEHGHVLHGAVRQAPHAHELPAAGFRIAGDRAWPDPVEVSHAHPPCPCRTEPPLGVCCSRSCSRDAGFAGKLPDLASTTRMLPASRLPAPGPGPRSRPGCRARDLRSGGPARPGDPWRPGWRCTRPAGCPGGCGSRQPRWRSGGRRRLACRRRGR